MCYRFRLVIGAIREFSVQIGMQVSAHITVQDHQNFRDMLSEDEDRTESNLEAAASLIGERRKMILSIAVLALAAGVASIFFNFSNSAHRISATTYGLLVLLTLPLGLVWIYNTSKLIRRLASGSHDTTLDAEAHKEGHDVGPVRFDFMVDSLHEKFRLVRTSYPWSAVEALRETSTLVCLMVDKDSAVFVPKRAFGDDTTLQAFKDMVAARIEDSR